MFLVFQGQFRNKVNFLGYYCKLFLYNISFFKPLTHTNMTLRNFLLCFAEFFSQIGWETSVRPGNSGKLGWCTNEANITANRVESPPLPPPQGSMILKKRIKKMQAESSGVNSPGVKSSPLQKSHL